MTESLTPKFGLDIGEFKAGIAELNRSIRVIESEFRATAAGMQEWDKSSAGLEARIKALTGEIDLQKTKVSATAAMYQKIATEQGAASRAAQEWQIKLNQETGKLNQMQAELAKSQTSLKDVSDEEKKAGSAAQDMADKTDKATESSSRMGSVLGGLGSALKVAAGLIAGLAAAAAGAVAGIAGLVMKASDAAGELVDLSNQTGISVTRLQELQYAGSQLGVSTETMTGSMAKLVRAMSATSNWSSPAARAFRELGVNVKDSSGNLRDNQEVFQDVITALGKVSNETERDALAMTLFGKSAQDLNPLISAGSDELTRLSREAHAVGAVMSEDAVGALEEFGDEVAGMKAGLQGSLGTLAAAFLPAFQQITGMAKIYTLRFSQIVSGAGGDLGAMASGLGGLAGEIITNIAQQAPQMLTAGLSILQGIGSAIMQALPALIPAVVTMITSLVGFIVQALPMLMQAGVQLLLALINGIVPQLPLLITAALQMILTLATGIAQALPQLIPTIIGIIPQIILILLQNMPLLIQAALQLILALAQGLIAAIPILIPYIPMIVQGIFDALIIALPMIGNAALQLIRTLGNGMLNNMPLITNAATRLVQVFGDKIKQLVKAMWDVGAALVSGVWEGINRKKDEFYEKVLAFFVGIVKAVKAALGIQSPSKVFAEIGQNMALGLGVGFERAFAGVEASTRAAVAGLGGMGPGAAAGAGAGATGAAGAAPVTITINAAVASEIDMHKLAYQVAAEFKRAR